MGLLGLVVYVPIDEILKGHPNPPSLGSGGHLPKLSVLLERDDHCGLPAQFDDLVGVLD